MFDDAPKKKRRGDDPELDTLVEELTGEMSEPLDGARGERGEGEDEAGAAAPGVIMAGGLTEAKAHVKGIRPPAATSGPAEEEKRVVVAPDAERQRAMITAVVYATRAAAKREVESARREQEARRAKEGDARATEEPSRATSGALATKGSQSATEDGALATKRSARAKGGDAGAQASGVVPRSQAGRARGRALLLGVAAAVLVGAAGVGIGMELSGEGRPPEAGAGATAQAPVGPESASSVAMQPSAPVPHVSAEPTSAPAVQALAPAVAPEPTIPAAPAQASEGAIQATPALPKTNVTGKSAPYAPPQGPERSAEPGRERERVDEKPPAMAASSTSPNVSTDLLPAPSAAPATAGPDVGMSKPEF